RVKRDEPQPAAAADDARPAAELPGAGDDRVPRSGSRGAARAEPWPRAAGAGGGGRGGGGGVGGGGPGRGGWGEGGDGAEGGEGYSAVPSWFGGGRSGCSWQDHQHRTLSHRAGRTLAII